MSKVITQMSISLDGFVGGAGEADWWPTHERLLGWVFDLASWRAMQGLEGGEENDASALLAEDIDRAGAYVLGRTMFDFGEEAWGDVPPYRAPVFILTHRARETVTKGGGTSYTFVTGGVAETIRQAKAAAGDKDVMISGGAGVVRAVLGAGLLDELHLHVAPVLLGRGVRLFEGLGDEKIELERLRAVETPAMTHLQFRVVKAE